MLVKNWMTKEVVTIDADASMQDAIKILKQNHIRMLPVLNNNKLVGIITDRDLKRASASDATTLDVHELLYLIMKIKVKSIMKKPVISVPENYTVEEAAATMLEHKISGVPVVDGSEGLVGVITQTDLFKVLISLTGMGARGVQVCLQIQDRSGTIKIIADIIRKYQGKIASILTAYDKIPGGYRKVYFRFFGVDRSTLENLIKELQAEVLLIYMVDHRENERFFYET